MTRDKQADLAKLKDIFDQLPDNRIERILSFAGMQLKEEFAAAADALAKPLPTVAPKLWKDRERGRKTNPVKFMKDVYGEWIGHGITRAYIKHLDKQLYSAYAQHIGRYPEEKLNLPHTSRNKIEDPELAIERHRESMRTRAEKYRARKKEIEPKPL